MIELLSLKVENFRSFTEATFIPATPDEGLTAITGRNGAGKSSLIHALMWAMYGETPHDVPAKGLRRQGTTEPVTVCVEFRHGGQTVKIVRSLRGKSDTSAVNIFVDGVQQTAISVRTANQWVTDRLRLDADSFLTAFVVRQKELDALLTDRPADRRKLVERLAGIERMRDALKAARADANELARAYDALPEPEGDPEMLRLAAEEAHRQAVLAAEVAASAATESGIAEESAKSVEAATQKAREDHETRRAANSRLQLLEANISAAINEVDRLSRVAAAAEGLPYAQAAADEAETDLKDAERCQQVAASARVEADRARAQSDRALAGKETAEAESVEADRALTQAKQQSAAHIAVNHLEAEQVRLREVKEQLAWQSGEARAEKVRAETAIAALEQHDDPTCPTCTQTLPDPAAVLSALRQAVAEAKAREADLGEQVAAAGSLLQELAGQAADAAAARNAAERASDRADVAQRTYLEACRSFEAAEAEAEAAERAASEAEAEASSLAADIGTLRRNVQDTRRVLAEAEVASAEAAMLPGKEAELHNLRGEAEALRDSIRDAGENVNLELLEADRVAAWRRHNAKLQTKHETAATSVAAAHAAADADRSVAAAEAAAARKGAALSAKEVASAAAAALDEFRKDRLSRLAPELSEVASDFVSRMTEGKYVSVELDDNFTPTLTDSDGNSRAASWLSGGEESAVALALRIAIGEVLSGNQGGLLVLDEVLTAQDSLRRAATMSAIRELPRQVIAINHVAEATDMADYVVEVQETPDGSVLVGHSRQQAVASLMEGAGEPV